MELVVQSRNLELPENVRQYLQRKMDRIDRRLPGAAIAHVELARERTRSQGDSISAQVTLDVNGTILRAEERAGNALAAIDLVVDVLSRRVQRYKGQAYRSEQARRGAKGGSVRELEAQGQEEEPRQVLEGLGRVVRVKRFPMKPMAVEEAAHQMELLGHNFFLFFNSEAETFNLLYKRRDGDYGLIEPDLP